MINNIARQVRRGLAECMVIRNSFGPELGECWRPVGHRWGFQVGISNYAYPERSIALSHGISKTSIIATPLPDVGLLIITV